MARAHGRMWSVAASGPIDPFGAHRRSLFPRWRQFFPLGAALAASVGLRNAIPAPGNVVLPLAMRRRRRKLYRSCSRCCPRGEDEGMSRVDDSASLLDRVPFPRGGARPWQSTRERGSRQQANSRLAKNTLALILAGGRGIRLKGLTDWRAKPALFFGGKHRIVDFALSNCVNSGIRRIGICTQYKAQSLIRHVQRGWSFFDGRFGEFVELLPAQQRVTVDWYKGTADAIYQNLDILRRHAPRYVLILAGDHVYKMNYAQLLAEHVTREADISIGFVEVPLATATQYGVMSVDDASQVFGFDEKPAQPKPAPG